MQSTSLIILRGNLSHSRDCNVSRLSCISQKAKAASMKKTYEVSKSSGDKQLFTTWCEVRIEKHVLINCTRIGCLIIFQYLYIPTLYRSDRKLFKVRQHIGDCRRGISGSLAPPKGRLFAQFSCRECCAR